MSSFLALKAKLEQLDRDIEAAREVEAAQAKETCRALIETFGFTAHGLGLIPTQVIKARGNGPHTFLLKTRRGPQPPRYRNPKPVKHGAASDACRNGSLVRTATNS
jgi:hypothetical protein